MHDLDDKEWKTNQSVISEKITDLTSRVKNILNDDNDVGSNNFSDDEEHNNNNNHNGNYSQTRNTHSTSSGSMKHSNTVAGKKFFLFPISKRKNVFLLLKNSLQ